MSLLEEWGRRILRGKKCCSVRCQPTEPTDVFVSRWFRRGLPSTTDGKASWARVVKIADWSTPPQEQRFGWFISFVPPKLVEISVRDSSSRYTRVRVTWAYTRKFQMFLVSWRTRDSREIGMSCGYLHWGKIVKRTTIHIQCPKLHEHDKK